MAASVMDVDVLEIEPDAEGRLRGDALREALERDGDGVFAVVATVRVDELRHRRPPR